jgi:hypothetical protein
MANSHPAAVTRAAREQARRTLLAMDLEVAALNLIQAADEVRQGNMASTKVQRVYQRVHQAITGVAEAAA